LVHPLQQPVADSGLLVLHLLLRLLRLAALAQLRPLPLRAASASVARARQLRAVVLVEDLVQ